jgi:uncharacterized membrane protein YdcZ (DUF606 family)
MRFSFVRYFVATVLFVSLTLTVAPSASAAPARDASEWSFRGGFVRIVRVVKDIAKKTVGRFTTETNDGLAVPRP